MMLQRESFTPAMSFCFWQPPSIPLPSSYSERGVACSLDFTCCSRTISRLQNLKLYQLDNVQLCLLPIRKTLFTHLEASWETMKPDQTFIKSLSFHQNTERTIIIANMLSESDFNKQSELTMLCKTAWKLKGNNECCSWFCAFFFSHYELQYMFTLQTATLSISYISKL